MAEKLPFLDEMYHSPEAAFGSPANQGYLESTGLSEPVLADSTPPRLSSIA